jgi:uncharacterized protein (TIGR00251 family)
MPTIPPIPFLRLDKHGDVLMDVHVIPNAGTTRIDGLYGEAGQSALRVRLNALSVEGKANEALIKWLAGQLGIPRKGMEVVRGKTSRQKQIKLSAELASQASWQNLLQEQHAGVNTGKRDGQR